MYDYYKILEIPRTASLDDIKRAYRSKAKLIHPDVNDSPKANEVFAIVNEAYEVLTDDQRRYLHDIKLNYADEAKIRAARKKQYYGSSVKNNTYSNFNYSDSAQSWDGYTGKGAYREKSDEDYFRRSPVLYNLFFASGMFIGFIIIIVTVIGTFKNYWPAPFVFIFVPGYILVREGWRGIMGKKTMIGGLIGRFKK